MKQGGNGSTRALKAIDYATPLHGVTRGGWVRVRTLPSPLPNRCMVCLGEGSRVWRSVRRDLRCSLDIPFCETCYARWCRRARWRYVGLGLLLFVVLGVMPHVSRALARLPTALEMGILSSAFLALMLLLARRVEPVEWFPFWGWGNAWVRFHNPEFLYFVLYERQSAQVTSSQVAAAAQRLTQQQGDRSRRSAKTKGSCAERAPGPRDGPA